MNTDLSAELRMMRQIIMDSSMYNDPMPALGPLETEEQIQATWEKLDEEDLIQDAKEDFRSSGQSTQIPCEWSRHYESDSVARKIDDGTWVGWTYWHGGGKHGEPGAIDWISEAYDLDVVEEEKLVTVYTFAKKS